MPAKGFWIVDNGNKFIQMKSIQQNHFGSAAIPWKGQSYDPQYDLNPLPNPFSVVKDKKLYSIFPPFFSLLSALFYSVLGLKGIYLIPFLSGLAIVLGILKIGRLLNFTENQKLAAMLLSAFATPILFYSFSFWEHTLAVCLVVWSIVQALLFNQKQRVKYLVASVLLATLAIYFRDELFIYIVVLTLSLLYVNKEGRLKAACIMTATFILTILPLFVCQYLLSGMPLGAHLSKHIHVAKSVIVHLKDRPQVIYNLFLALFSPKFISSILIVFYLMTITGYYFLAKKWQKIMTNLFTILIIIHSLMLLILSFDSRILSKLLDSNSLFAASPFLLLLLIRNQQADKQSGSLAGISFLRKVTAGFILVYLVAAPKVGSTGIHWGCRFLLLLYPLLTILLVNNFKDRFSKTLTLKNLGLIAILLLSLLLQVSSLYLLFEKKSFNGKLNEYILQRPEQIIITNIWHAPQDLSFNFDKKLLFYFKNKTQMARINQILKQLKTEGIGSVLFISPATRSIEPGILTHFKFRESTIFSFRIKTLKL